jgi:alcohol oxidase
MSIFTGYPLSRGSIHITNSSPSSPATFKTGFLSDARGVDIKKHVWAYKKQREIFRRMKTCTGELALLHPPFVSTSDARIQTWEATAPASTDIEYSAADDEVLEEYIHGHVETTWHSLGTCKMGPRSEGGVVDANLSVYGVQGLKIADLSVPPRNVAANTMNTAVAIAEKAADIIIEELGL